MKKLIRGALWTVAVVTFGLGALSALMFYQSYLKWYGSFENGRYFDPEYSVVHHESSAIIGVIAALMWMICAAAVLLARRSSAKT